MRLEDILNWLNTRTIGKQFLLKQHSHRPMAWQHTSLIISLTLYGGALGAAAGLVALLSRFEFPVEPERIGFLDSFFFASGGALAGIILTWPTAFWISQRTPGHSNLLVWWGLGLTYGILAPFAAGGFLPLTTMLLNLASGTMDWSELVSGLETVFRVMPFSIVNNGGRDLYTWLIAGAIFGTGSWIIDRIDSSSNLKMAQSGTWIFTLGLATFFLAFAIWGPVDFLATLG